MQAKPGIETIIGMLSKPVVDGNRYWEHPRDFQAKDLQLQFIDFFQWDNYDFMSMASTRCLIAGSSHSPEYIGREIIIENYLLDFFFR